jgi:excisionase family DNA binding protein
MTVREVSQALGVSLDYAYSLIWGGRLDAVRVDGRWDVSEESVRARKGRLAKRDRKVSTFEEVGA